MALTVRSLTPTEQTTLQHLVRERTAPARAVERARLIWAAHQGQRVPAIATRLGLSPKTVRLWLTRFNDQGLPGLQDQPRRGRPVTYGPQQVGLVLTTARADPQTLGLPFASWTLDRLHTYLATQHGLAMQRSRLNEVLQAEGLRWRTQETWFGERVDPAFTEKRGPSSPSTPARLPTVSSSV